MAKRKPGTIVTLKNGARAKVLKNGRLQFIKGGKRKSAAKTTSKRGKVSTRRASTTKVKTVAKKKPTRRSRSRKMNPERIARGLATANTVLQLTEPVASRALPPLMSGDLNGAIRGAKEGAKAAIQTQNLMEAFVPQVSVEVGIGAIKATKSFARSARSIF